MLYLLLGLPALVGLVLGRLHRGGDPWFAISLAAVPVGLVFLGASRRRGGTGRPGDYANKLAGFALAQALFAVLFRLTMSGGSQRFHTAYAFLAMFASFLSLVAALLLVAGMLRNRESGEAGGSGTAS